MLCVCLPRLLFLVPAGCYFWCVCVRVYVRRDRRTGRQCAHVWMEQTSAAHLLPTSRQRKSHPSLLQLPGQQGTHTCTCTYAESLRVCVFLSVQSDCAELCVFSPCSAELLMEKGSSVSGRSTRHRPTLNPTWWGLLLHPVNHHASTHMHTPVFKSNMCRFCCCCCCCCALSNRAGSATLKPAVILPSSHPLVWLPRPDSLMITGWHLRGRTAPSHRP